MKTIQYRTFSILTALPMAKETGTGHPDGYLLGGIIALLILVYLIYSLVKPEKF